VEYLIIDEACQSVEAETWIALQSLPAHLLVVGDPKQLNATIISLKLKPLAFQRPLMERLMLCGAPHLLLDTQYRMHPEIAAFPNLMYYGGVLKNGENVTKRAGPTLLPEYGPCAFFDLQNGIEISPTGKSSICNPREVTYVVNLVKKLMKRVPKQEIVVITFYSLQVLRIRERLEANDIQDVRVETVDSFQGSEATVTILSFVRSNEEGDVGFVSQPNRLNVAITRAKLRVVRVRTCAHSFKICATVACFTLCVLRTKLREILDRSFRNGFQRDLLHGNSLLGFPTKRTSISRTGELISSPKLARQYSRPAEKALSLRYLRV